MGAANVCFAEKADVGRSLDGITLVSDEYVRCPSVSRRHDFFRFGPGADNQRDVRIMRLGVPLVARFTSRQGRFLSWLLAVRC
jgi:hypothetical protein